MIRQAILDTFRAHGKPVALDQIAEQLGISPDELSQLLAQQQRITKLEGVSMKEAGDLISFYGRDFLFAENIVNTVEQFLAGRKKIEGYEKKARDVGLLPPEENK